MKHRVANPDLAPTGSYHAYTVIEYYDLNNNTSWIWEYNYNGNENTIVSVTIRGIT